MTFSLRIRWLEVSALMLVAACETSTSTTPSASDAGAPDSGVALDADAAPAVDAGAPDCALADEDRDDAGQALMKLDRAKIGKICWTPDAGDIAACGPGEACSIYRLPEDPPLTARCGPGCDAATCPGELTCVMPLSRLGGPSCACE